jgi:hypothetical protein
MEMDDHFAGDRIMPADSDMLRRQRKKRRLFEMMQDEAMVSGPSVNIWRRSNASQFFDWKSFALLRAMADL